MGRNSYAPSRPMTLMYRNPLKTHNRSSFDHRSFLNPLLLILMGTNKRRDRDRCDHVLTVQGLAQSRDAAVRMILAGKVKSNGAIVDKPSRVIPTDAVIEIIGESKPFVSRGGENWRPPWTPIRSHLAEWSVSMSGARPEGSPIVCSKGGLRGSTRLMWDMVSSIGGFGKTHASC